MSMRVSARKRPLLENIFVCWLPVPTIGMPARSMCRVNCRCRGGWWGEDIDTSVMKPARFDRDGAAIGTTCVVALFPSIRAGSVSVSGASTAPTTTAVHTSCTVYQSRPLRRRQTDDAPIHMSIFCMKREVADADSDIL